MTATKSGKPSQVRCAIYTRKSTEEGLEKEFNTLDAQRESGEAYITSQVGSGWVCLPTRYDDGGYTGGNMDRPALQRLLADIVAGKVDVVIAYKIDRLSRSLLDFAKMMDVFDQHHVSFASVTQQFNSASSMGRLVLNVLLSFAQFEREIIGERTRDKIAATRRKGKWAGGMPLLGYDVVNSKLVVNEAEAKRTRAIFELYRKHQALLPVVQELERRGWKTKRWTTRKGRTRGGVAFTRTNLYHLLTRVAYIGKVQHKTETHQGEQRAIVDGDLWHEVQELLRQHGRRDPVRHNSGALLRSLIRCSCGCRMTPTYCLKNATTRYRYYKCLGAVKRGVCSCPSRSVPAGTIEAFVLQQVRALAGDPERLQAMQGSRKTDDTAETLDQREGIEPGKLRLILDPAWDRLDLAERAAILSGLIEQVIYDGASSKVTITFRREGIQVLANQGNHP